MSGEEDLGEEFMVQLNMDHPANKAMAEFMENATDDEIDAFTRRFMRRGGFEDARLEIGTISRPVARGLIRMFRAGFQGGHIVGYGKGERDAR
jgi:hypothetical protein